MPLGRVLQTCNELALSCPSMCLKLHPLPFNVYVLHFPTKVGCVSPYCPPSCTLLFILHIHCHRHPQRLMKEMIISLYMNISLIVLLNIEINNLNSATSRQATQVVGNVIYQQTLACLNRYNVPYQCMDVLVIDSIITICGLIWNEDSDDYPFNEMKINVLMIVNESYSRRSIPQ